MLERKGGTYCGRTYSHTQLRDFPPSMPQETRHHSLVLISYSHGSSSILLTPPIPSRTPISSSAPTPRIPMSSLHHRPQMSIRSDRSFGRRFPLLGQQVPQLRDTDSLLDGAVLQAVEVFALNWWHLHSGQPLVGVEDEWEGSREGGTYKLAGDE